MADNEIDLMQWQIGTQTVFDTAVAPTAKLIGVTEGEIAPVIETSAVREQRATLAQAYQATVDSVTGEATVSGEATFEQIGYHLDSLLGQATPGAGPGYTREHAGPIGSKPSPRILTLTHGSSLDARCLKGAIGNEFTLSGETNKRLTYESKFIGHSVEADTLASLSDISPNYIHANQAVISLDTWDGTMGGTVLDTIAYNFEIGLNMNKAVRMGIGSSRPKGHKHMRSESDNNQLKLSLELDATTAGYYNNIITATSTPWQAQIQIAFTLGSLLFTIQYAGYAAEAPVYIADTDGIATLEFVFSPMYHPVFANWFKSSLTNGIAVLP